MEGRQLFKYVFICVVLHANCMVPGLLNRGRGGTVPVQMDMVSDDSITICTGAKRALGCREGANIAVTNVFWGRLSDKICPSDDGDPIVDCDAAPDSMTLVKAQCEGKRECSLTAKHNLLQKEHSSHCPGVNKYLQVKFTCVPESKGILLCDSAETEISCEAGWTMQLADVFWGRRASTRTCGLTEGFECDASETATNYLKNKCNGQHTCLVQNDATILDPAKRSSCGDAMEKYLMMNYVCSPASARDETTTEEPVEEKLKKTEEKPKEEVKVKEEEKAPKSPSTTAESSFPKQQQKQEQQPSANLSPPASPAVAGSKPAGSASTLLANKNSTAAQISGVSTSSNNKKPSSSSNAKNEKTAEEEEEELEKKSGAPTASATAGKEAVTDSTSASVDTASVRSILSRAKNILKTLDIDNNGNDVRKKRFRIARPDKLSIHNSAQQKQKQQQKKMTVPGAKSGNQKGNEFPDNFILKSWYGK